jgi:hypothetical protein
MAVIERRYEQINATFTDPDAWLKEDTVTVLHGANRSSNSLIFMSVYKPMVAKTLTYASINIKRCSALNLHSQLAYVSGISTVMGLHTTRPKKFK